MYIFNKEMKKKLLGKRTITELAEMIGITRPNLNNILNAKRPTTKMTAYCITKALNSELEICQVFTRLD